MQAKSSSALVYSTEAGRICPDCAEPQAQCRCAANKRAALVAAGDGVARVQLETKGRGGKSVTVVRGLPLEEAALVLLAKQLKAACGSGGTAKEGVIEVQGGHMEAVMAALTKRGFRVKKVGG